MKWDLRREAKKVSLKYIGNALPKGHPRSDGYYTEEALERDFVFMYAFAMGSRRVIKATDQQGRTKRRGRFKGGRISRR